MITLIFANAEEFEVDDEGDQGIARLKEKGKKEKR